MSNHRRPLLLTALAPLTLLAVTACGGSGTDTAGAGAAGKDITGQPEAVRTANAMLALIRSGDVEGMRKLLNKTNRSMNEDRLRGALEEMKRETVGDITSVVEIRKSNNRYPDGTMFAKIKDEGNETFVIVMTPEDGKLLFEDINSPSTASYNALEKVWP